MSAISPRPYRRWASLAGCVTVLCASVFTAQGADRTWVPGSDSWNATGAWIGGVLGAGDHLFFAPGSGDSEHDMGDAFQIGNLTFRADAGAYTLSGDSLTLGGNISHLGVGLQTISNDLILSGNRILNIAEETGHLELAGDISGAYSLTKTGRGDLTLSGANTYSGNTSFYFGKLTLDFSTSSPESVLNVNQTIDLGGAHLHLKGADTGETLQTLRQVNLRNGTLIKFSFDDHTGSGTRLHIDTLGFLPQSSLSTPNIHLDLRQGGSLTFTNAPTLYNGVIGTSIVRDTGGIGFATVSEEKELIRFTGTTALPTDGAATVAEGNYITSGNVTRSAATTFQTLTLDASDSAGSLTLEANLTFRDGGGLLKYGNHAYTIRGAQFGPNFNDSFAFHVFDNGALTIESNIVTNRNVNLTKTGDGRLIFAGTGNRPAAGGVHLSINEGVVQFNSDYLLTVYTNVDDGLQFGANIREITLGGLAHTVSLPSIRTRLENINDEAVTLTLSGGNAKNFNGVLYGSGAVMISGGGINSFSGNSTYTGGTTIRNGGTLVLELINTLSTTGDIIIDGGTLGRTSNNLIQTTTGAFRLLSGAVISNSNGNGILTKNGGSFELHSGSIGYLTLAGSAGLIKTSEGTVELNLRQGTYAGATLVQEGKLLVNSIITQSAIIVDAGAILGGNGSVRTISGAGTVAPGNSPGMLTATAADPTGGLDFSFEITRPASNGESAPNFANLSNIGNDVLYLTDAAPFTVALTVANVITVDFSAITLSLGDVYLGGFFAATDFGVDLTNATFQFIGVGEEYIISTSTLSHTANFSSGAVNGYITAFEVQAIPEPGTVAMLIGSGLLLAGWQRSRRRKTTSL